MCNRTDQKRYGCGNKGIIKFKYREFMHGRLSFHIISIGSVLFLTALLLLNANAALAWSVNARHTYVLGLPDAYSAAAIGCALNSGKKRIAGVSFTSPGTAHVACESYDATTAQWWWWREAYIAAEPDDSGYFMDAREFENEGQGESCTSSKHPINLINGNKYKIYTDISNKISSGISRPGFKRYYNSQSTLINSPIGNKWTHSYDRRMLRNDSLRTSENVYVSSAGNQFDPFQSVLYSTRQAACESGILEITNQSSELGPGPFQNLQAFKSAEAQWVNGECRIFVDGRYRANYSISTHGVPREAGSKWDDYLRFYRPDGNVIKFQKTYSGTAQNMVAVWKEEFDAGFELDEIDVTPAPVDNEVVAYRINYVLTDPDKVKETYDYSGKLLYVDYPNGLREAVTYRDGLVSRVDNSLGQYIDIQYNDGGYIDYISDESGRVWQYRYFDTNLVEVINPDHSSVKYHYENNSYPGALTGVTDERNIRVSTFDYYDDGLAKSSYLGKPDALPESRIDNVSVIYGPVSNTVTNSRGYQTTYYYSDAVLKGLLTQYDGPECVACANGSKTYDYDIDLQSPNNSTLNLLSKTEYGQNTTFEDYDENGNPGIVTEAVATPEERSTNYTYDPRYQSKIKTKSEPSVYVAGSKVTTYTYDDFGNTTSITVNGYRPDATPVVRSHSFVYNGPYHQLSEIDGPRTDVDDIYKIIYHPDSDAEGNNRARVETVTAPLGVVLYDNITYTATGNRASYTTGANLRADFTYYPGNDRLETQSLTDLSSGKTRTTRWTYIATGEVESITQGYATPEATTLKFVYDDARRLSRIYDSFNNYIEYELDTEGNVINENIYDQSNNLLKTLNKSFDAYNRLDISAQVNETHHYNFSPDGTLDLEMDGKSVVTDYSYDALRRLTSIAQDLGGTDPVSANALTQFGYDAQDNLVSVTDPNGGQTQYVYDDLGNLLLLSSPDTGITAYTHNEAGNVTTLTDARGQLFDYSYDALGRITNVDAPATADDIAFDYDWCQNGAGRLCTVTTGAAAVGYSYNAFGNITTHQGVNYSYDAANRIADITYPSGAIVAYTYDAADQVSHVSLELDGQTIPLASNISYAPFGGITGLAYGNGLPFTQHWDAAYRLISQSIADILSLDYPVYDANGNLTQRDDATEDPPVSSTFGYDALDRLTDASGPFGSGWMYEYDRNGNRTQTNESAAVSLTYEPASNRLDAIGTADVILDSVGNTLDNGDWHYTYTAHNRLATVSQAGVNVASYTYNGLSQRVTKTLAGDMDVNYVYALEGALLAETDAAGVALKEYVYLNGAPLALIDHDRDSDGVRNADDNCIDALNGLLRLDFGGHSQRDTDGDGYGNRCDADFDQSGFVNAGDLAIFKSRYFMTDPDADLSGDGIVNAADLEIFNSLFFKPVGPSGVNDEAGTSPVYMFHTDHLGTPQMLTDENGAAVWSAVYDPFGKATVNEDLDGDGNSVTLNIRLPGQYYDVESGLHYNYFRTYDPSTGRYITSDPIGLDGGLNTYGYTFNNPKSLIDPLGLYPALVGRALQGAAGDYAGHMYVVTDAEYVGDPNAKVHSYGKSNASKRHGRNTVSGLTGKVDNGTTGISATTHAADIQHWTSLGGMGCSMQNDYVSPIPASDSDVNYWAERVKPSVKYHHPIPFIGRSDAVNSNSAAQAVANKASDVNVPIPSGPKYGYPGASQSPKVIFK